MIDPRTEACDHPPRHGLRHEERGALVQRDDGVVVLFGHLEERRGPVGAGVVHQHIERRLCVDRGAHGGEVGHVQHQRFGAAAFVADLRGCRLDLGCGARGQDDVRAGLRQGCGGGEADAAAGAGDQRAAAFKAQGGCAREEHEGPQPS